MPKTIIVIFGGASNENEISVITGTLAANVLKNGGDTVLPVYIDFNGDFYEGDELADINVYKDGSYKKCARAVIANGGVFILGKRGKTKKFIKADAALNCCHGGLGEGGALCGLFGLANIPFAGAGLFESAGFMDKYLTKIILNSLGVKTARFAYLKSVEQAETCRDMPEFPVIVKPVNLGSSIGVEKADDPRQLRTALESAFIYDGAVIVERFFENRREINCAAYFAADEVVTGECEEAFAGGDLLSFEDKYCGGGKSVLPADIPTFMSHLIKNIVKEVYTKLNMRGIVRFDFIVCGDEVYLSEINTVPGSLSYYLLSKGFKDFYGILNAVIEQALKDYSRSKSKKLLKTGILQNIPSNACKLGSK